MTTVEARAVNAGGEAVLDIARRSGEAIARNSRRRVHEDFAVAAWAEIAEAGRALLIASPSLIEQQGEHDG